MTRKLFMLINQKGKKKKKQTKENTHAHAHTQRFVLVSLSGPSIDNLLLLTSVTGKEKFGLL